MLHRFPNPLQKVIQFANKVIVNLEVCNINLFSGNHAPPVGKLALILKNRTYEVFKNIIQTAQPVA